MVNVTDMTDTTLIAQISDLHIDGSERATARLRRTMDALYSLAEPPAALLVTGDIADSGSADEYAEVLELTKASFPVLYCPGNHDDRAAFRSGLLGEDPGTAAQGPVNRAHRIGGLTVLMCDSTLPRRNEGLLDTGTLAWIEQQLDELGPEESALLAFHHPPVPVHVPMLDAMLLRNPDQLVELLERHPEVVGIVNGHAHTPAASVLAGRPVLLCPAVTWTMRLPAREVPSTTATPRRGSPTTASPADS